MIGKDEFVLTDDLSSLELTDSKVLHELIKKSKIQSVYLPIDGTRRYVRRFAKSNISDMELVNLYFKKINETVPQLIETFAELGMRYIVILCMDRVAFGRGDTFNKLAIEHGVKALVRPNSSFMELYDKLNARVIFGGFNNLYDEYGFPEMHELFKQVEVRTKDRSGPTILWYSGFDPHEDYLALGELYLKYSEKLSSMSREESMGFLMETLYREQFPTIDAAFFYAYPRSIIIPPLLNKNTIFLYTREPSLAIDKKTALYGLGLAALGKLGIMDKFPTYFSKDVPKAPENMPSIWADNSYKYPEYHLNL